MLLMSGNSINVYAETPPLKAGEVITYDIKKFMVRVGQATLAYDGPVDIDGRRVISVTVTADGFNFYDQERIYLDPETFHPVMIKRDLDIFGVKETIMEHYDTNRGHVRIVKVADGETTETEIERGERFDNIYGFIYRQRSRGSFKENDAMNIHLPTQDVNFEFVKMVEFNRGGEHFDAYYLRSNPRKYVFMFDNGPRKIPLRIDGAIGFGSTSMIYAGRDMSGS